MLVLGSKDDSRTLLRIAMEIAAQIAEKVGNQTELVLYLYDGYGHAAYDTAPDYKERILDFLRSGPKN